MVSAAHAPRDHANHRAIRASDALAPDYRALYSLPNRSRSTDTSETHHR
jgi:hypothetical protein